MTSSAVLHDRDLSETALGATLTRCAGVGAAFGLLFFALLVPVGGVGATSVQGASTVRTIALVTLVLVGLVAAGGIRESVRMPIVGPVIVAFLLLGAIGAVVSAVNAESLRDFVSMSASAAGQPVLYGATLFLFVRVLDARSANRDLLFAAWAVTMIVEAGIVLWQLESGRAYDAVRDITRAGGTVGADFAGAVSLLSMLGLGAIVLDTAARRYLRVLGIAGMIASVFVLVSVVSRGPLVAAGIGIAYIGFATLRGRSDRKRPLILAGALCIILAGGYLLGQDMWEGRLNQLKRPVNIEKPTSKPTKREIVTLHPSRFDRAATWVSGLRIGWDHSLAGTGPGNVFETVKSSSRYQETPFGNTYTNPHNAWIYAFAECGIFYALALIAATILLIRGAVMRRPAGRASLRFVAAGLIAVFPLFAINNDFSHPEVMIFVLLSVAVLIQVSEEKRIEA